MNNNQVGPYQTIELPVGRRIWINALNAPGPTRWMTGLLEVDVTRPRQLLADYKARHGETLSFTGFLIYCLAQAVEENKEVQAYIKGGKQVVLPEQVNVGMMVEHAQNGKRALMGHVLQDANHKSLAEINEEIRRVQCAPVPANRGMPGWFRKIMQLPWPLSLLVRAGLGLAARQDPTVRIGAGGTVSISSIGMFGRGHSGWAIATTAQTLSVFVGSITWKPGVVDGRIEPREILHLTLMLDHEVVDGAPAARFTSRLLELIESGSGLQELVAEGASQAEAPL